MTRANQISGRAYLTNGRAIGGSAIPDSVVSRGADDSTSQDDRDLGIVFDVSQDWPDFQAEISSNVVTNSDNTVMRIGDTTGTILQTEDISGLSAGSVVTFNDINLTAGNTYQVSIETTDGDNYTVGISSETNYPYTSSDGNLEITARWNAGDVQSGKNAFNIVTIGNINL